MARRGKTIIKGQGSKSREQMAASQSGQASVQRQDEFAGQQSAHALDRAGQQGTQVAGIIQRHTEMKSQEGMEKERVDLRAAESGLMRNPQDERKKKLQDEMGKGSVEMTGQRFVPTPQARSQAASKQALAEEKGITERMRAQAYRAQVSSQIQSAHARGDKKGVAELEKNLMQPIKSEVNRLDRLMTGGKKARPGDWEQLAKEAETTQDPELIDEISKNIMTPRIRDFISRKIAVQSLDFIEDTGNLPDGDLVDFTTPVMQQFSKSAQVVSMLMEITGGYDGITSLAEKNRFVNQLAAWHTKKILANPVQGQSMMPSQAASPEQQQAQKQNEQPQPPPEAGLGQPGGAALQQGAGAGARADPSGRSLGDVPSTWQQAK